MIKALELANILYVVMSVQLSNYKSLVCSKVMRLKTVSTFNFVHSQLLKNNNNTL